MESYKDVLYVHVMIREIKRTCHHVVRYYKLCYGKRMFYARTFLLYKNDMRKTWGVINDTLQSNRRSRGQSEFIFGNRIISDSDEIANHFNDYFINISRTLSQQIQPVHSFDHYLNGNVTSKFQFHSASQDYIGKLIDNLKNKASYGHDNISIIF